MRTCTPTCTLLYVGGASAPPFRALRYSRRDRMVRRELISENIIPYGLKKKAFLAAFRETGNVRVASQAAQISRASHYRWLQEPDYAEEFEQAKADAVDVLEAEARRRAVEGYMEPVGWYKGQAGGTVRRYSDALLIFLLKGAAPEKYRERLEVRGALARIDFGRMTDEQLARIAAGEHPYAVLAPTRDLLGGSRRHRSPTTSRKTPQETTWEPTPRCVPRSRSSAPAVDRRRGGDVAIDETNHQLGRTQGQDDRSQRDQRVRG